MVAEGSDPVRAVQTAEKAWLKMLRVKNPLDTRRKVRAITVSQGISIGDKSPRRP